MRRLSSVACSIAAAIVGRHPTATFRMSNGTDYILVDMLPPLLPIYREAITAAVETATDFGCNIVVSDTLLRYVARTVASGGDTVTPRAGMGWLQAAVDAAYSASWTYQPVPVRSTSSAQTTSRYLRCFGAEPGDASRQY